MAVLVLSTPRMFEGGFKKWLQSKQLPGESVEDVREKISDPLQNFMTETFNNVVKVSNCDCLDSYYLYLFRNFRKTNLSKSSMISIWPRQEDLRFWCALVVILLELPSMSDLNLCLLCQRRSNLSSPRNQKSPLLEFLFTLNSADILLSELFLFSKIQDCLKHLSNNLPTIHWSGNQRWKNYWFCSTYIGEMGDSEIVEILLRSIRICNWSIFLSPQTRDGKSSSTGSRRFSL